MEDGRENKIEDADRDTWADEFFAGVINGEEEKPKNPGLYGQFDLDAGNDERGGAEQAPLINAEPVMPEAGPSEDSEAPETHDEKPDRDEKTTVALFAVGIVILILLGILCGFFIGRAVTRAKAGSSSKESQKSGEASAFSEKGASAKQIEKLEEIFNFISENYYKQTDPDELLEGAVAGMVASIDDPYGKYYRPGKMDPYRDYIDGKYTGIGVTVTAVEEGFNVTSVEAGSPAAGAGIAVGDIIIEIDDEKLAGKSVADVEGILSKKEATFSIVLLTTDGEKTVTCSTDKLTKHIVSGSDLGNGIIYIRIEQFTPDAPSEFEKVLGELKNENTRGLVIDLRDNPGGYVGDAVKIADMLLPEGVISVAKNRSGEVVETYKSDKNAAGLKMAVLVNGYTASAAELVAGAIRDFNAGTVVGETTYGKALGQVLKTFDHDGSGLSLSAYRYYTPSGECIDGVGITPAVIVEPEEAYKDQRVSAIPFENDAQLKAAIDLFEG